jgi:hypothetical protein
VKSERWERIFFPCRGRKNAFQTYSYYNLALKAVLLVRKCEKDRLLPLPDCCAASSKTSYTAKYSCATRTKVDALVGDFEGSAPSFGPSRVLSSVFVFPCRSTPKAGCVPRGMCFCLCMPGHSKSWMCAKGHTFAKKNGHGNGKLHSGPAIPCTTSSACARAVLTTGTRTVFLTFRYQIFYPDKSALERILEKGPLVASQQSNQLAACRTVRRYAELTSATRNRKISWNLPPEGNYGRAKKERGAVGRLKFQKVSTKINYLQK